LQGSESHKVSFFYKNTDYHPPTSSPNVTSRYFGEQLLLEGTNIEMFELTFLLHQYIIFLLFLFLPIVLLPHTGSFASHLIIALAFYRYPDMNRYE